MRTEEDDERMRQRVAELGWIVQCVMDDPPFGYTVGISTTFGQPELLMTCVGYDLAVDICNTYGSLVKEGTTFKEGDIVDDWLENGRVMLLSVKDEFKPEILGVAVDVLRNREVPALQAVWSWDDGSFPWDKGWPTGRYRQPLFCAVPYPS